MFSLASLRSDWWTTCPELVDDFVGIRSQIGDLVQIALNDGRRDLLQDFAHLDVTSLFRIGNLLL
jgi:hypothetical protein